MLFYHHAAGGRVNRQVVRGLALALDALDLLLLQPEQAQLFPRRLNRRLRRLPNRRTAVNQALASAQGLDQLLLGSQQLGAVEIGYMVALFDPHTRVVQVHPVNPARYPSGDSADLRLIYRNFADHPRLNRRKAALDRRSLDAGKLLRGGRQTQLARPQRIASLGCGHRN